MGGWTGEGKDTIEWDGTIRAKKLKGNGAEITLVNAETTDSYHLNQELKTTSSPAFAGITINGNLLFSTYSSIRPNLINGAVIFQNDLVGANNYFAFKNSGSNPSIIMTMFSNSAGAGLGLLENGDAPQFYQYLKAPDLTSHQIWTFPIGQAGGDSFLKINAAGQMSYDPAAYISSLTASTSTNLDGYIKGNGSVLSAVASSLPAGLIAMWHGLIANIPSGWKLCDGTNGTPDLRDKFVRGAADGIEAGGTGGNPTHVHSADGEHSHTFITAAPGAENNSYDPGATNALADTGHNHTGATDGVSTTHAHDAQNHEPPYYDILFIMST